MGAILPIATQAIGVAQTVGTVASVLGATTNIIRSQNGRSAEQELNQLRDKQRLDERNAAEKAALSRQETQAQTAEAETKRRNDLKRAVARQRAKFGGAGVSSNDGSSEAVLLGIFDESEEERMNRERLDNIRLASIDQSLGNTKRVNTLKRTQLEQRRKLGSLTETRGRVEDLID